MLASIALVALAAASPASAQDVEEDLWLPLSQGEWAPGGRPWTLDENNTAVVADAMQSPNITNSYSWYPFRDHATTHGEDAQFTRDLWHWRVNVSVLDLPPATNDTYPFTSGPHLVTTYDIAWPGSTANFSQAADPSQPIGMSLLRLDYVLPANVTSRYRGPEGDHVSQNSCRSMLGTHCLAALNERAQSAARDDLIWGGGYAIPECNDTFGYIRSLNAAPGRPSWTTDAGNIRRDNERLFNDTGRGIMRGDRLYTFAQPLGDGDDADEAYRNATSRVHVMMMTMAPGRGGRTSAVSTGVHCMRVDGKSGEDDHVEDEDEDTPNGGGSGGGGEDGEEEEEEEEDDSLGVVTAARTSGWALLLFLGALMAVA